MALQTDVTASNTKNTFFSPKKGMENSYRQTTNGHSTTMIANSMSSSNSISSSASGTSQSPNRTRASASNITVLQPPPRGWHPFPNPSSPNTPVHYEPPGGLIVEFSILYMMRKRRLFWRRGCEPNSALLNSSSAEDDFAEYHNPRPGLLHRSLNYFLGAPPTPGGQDGQITESELTGIAAIGLGPSAPEIVVLERPTGRFNRLIFHCLRAMIYEYDLRYQNRYEHDISEYRQIDPHKLHADLQEITGSIFAEGVRWGHVVAFLTWIGGMAVQFYNREMIERIDTLAEYAVTLLGDLITDWVEANEGWTGFIRNFFGNTPAQGNTNPLWSFRYRFTPAPLFADDLTYRVILFSHLPGDYMQEINLSRTSLPTPPESPSAFPRLDQTDARHTRSPSHTHNLANGHTLANGHSHAARPVAVAAAAAPAQAQAQKDDEDEDDDEDDGAENIKIAQANGEVHEPAMPGTGATVTIGLAAATALVAAAGLLFSRH